MPTEILPISHLRHYGTRYPQAWRMADALRARQGTEHFPAWPHWCYLPAGYVERYIVAEGRPSFSIERAFDPMILAALCAWRMGKGVYRFDPELLEELWQTPVTGEIPGEVLLRLPEWCVYLELPDKKLSGEMDIRGCFAFLDWEPRFSRAELCLCNVSRIVRTEDRPGERAVILAVPYRAAVPGTEGREVAKSILVGDGCCDECRFG
jgi:hypothetical protein